jgi:hypothetical protein
MEENGVLAVIRRLLGTTGSKKETKISRALMKMMLLSGDTFTIHTSKLSGAKMKRTMFAVEGPTGNVDYNYSAKGYMILYDFTKLGYRTVVLNKITKLVDELGNVYVVQ